MLEHFHNRIEASYRVSELATQIFTEYSNVLKLHYIRRAVSHSYETIAIDDAEKLQTQLLNPNYAKFFAGSELSPHDDSYFTCSIKNTEGQLSCIMSYVAISGLVFAHSFIEDLIEKLLNLTRLCDTETWLSLIGKKSIEISNVLENGIEHAVGVKLDEYFETFRNKSLIDKIDILARLLKCKITTSHVINYTYSADRIKSLDQLRHDFAHHKQQNYSLEQAESDLVYLYDTAHHFLDLVVSRYDLVGTSRPSLDTECESKR